MPSPTGSVPALSSAASTIFSIGIVFLGYWGVHEPAKWRFSDVTVVVFALVGFACLGLVPWMATRPVATESSDAGVRVARRLFLAGVAAIWLAVTLSVVA
ncbi:hypothetical protein R69927_06928 [Paraburkholderia domus]|jgi:hypothetical protein|uniref:Uncharacterized protein n=1 Tax=Paraburkholderia domus TaxID=2793075 RepID=A0A9N8MTI1_9BURK|nr:hypothetical protein [Paraburkholderia domus]MBK5051083.1 hypothetical protein [Burkholderia sp. R-70006]MBK5065023.1 hypothetical protein [Burkholderia sp. R-70199]MBK5091010.1 hypothetical protein [Burkholderia sp. R-69927]MBK5118661.1 hypothetical protein [Burkholderia sp. R-69980]MBK5164499.1 hypothetical protein [Burkholderia sp. R-70211]MBK5181806.1 hypothetical protein [Burkholderia sp. R-69749]MCI0144681.1 hypothetical protein [Paraburkholderia sediminicola]